MTSTEIGLYISPLFPDQYFLLIIFFISTSSILWFDLLSTYFLLNHFHFQTGEKRYLKIEKQNNNINQIKTEHSRKLKTRMKKLTNFRVQNMCFKTTTRNKRKIIQIVLKTIAIQRNKGHTETLLIS